ALASRDGKRHFPRTSWPVNGPALFNARPTWNRMSRQSPATSIHGATIVKIMHRAFCGAAIVAIAVLSSAFAVAADAQPKSEDGGWIQLFNGKNLDGWTPKIRYYDLGENFGDTFRVEDGLLKVRYDKYDKFGARFGHL